jgi:hypothetical protein
MKHFWLSLFIQIFLSRLSARLDAFFSGNSQVEDSTFSGHKFLLILFTKESSGSEEKVQKNELIKFGSRILIFLDEAEVPFQHE